MSAKLIERGRGPEIERAGIAVYVVCLLPQIRHPLGCRGGSTPKAAREVMEGKVMVHIPDNVPKHMHSTYVLLRSAYPEGIPDKDYFPLLAVMADTGMSNRSIAEAMGLYFGKKYIEFLHDVAHVLPNTVMHEDEKCRILRRFQPHGFEQWAQED